MKYTFYFLVMLFCIFSKAKDENETTAWTKRYRKLKSLPFRTFIMKNFEHI